MMGPLKCSSHAGDEIADARRENTAAAEKLKAMQQNVEAMRQRTEAAEDEKASLAQKLAVEGRKVQDEQDATLQALAAKR